MQRIAGFGGIGLPGKGLQREGFWGQGRWQDAETPGTVLVSPFFTQAKVENDNGEIILCTVQKIMVPLHREYKIGRYEGYRITRNRACMS